MDKFFRNKQGHFAIWQRPNLPILGWFLFKIISLLTSNRQVAFNFGQLSGALLFTWAYLEITKGDSHFRRVLGAVVMVAVVIGYFK